MANIELDGVNKTIKVDSGDLTVDVPNDIILDADDGKVRLKDGGTEIGRFVLDNGSGDLEIVSSVSDKDIKLKGVDGGVNVTALTLDMSDGGAATLNNGLTLTDGNLVVASGHGIDFSATSDGTTMSSELFDDYEEGSYNPTVICETSGSYGLVAGSDTLQYTKVGRKVTIQGLLNPNSESSPNGALKVSLPYTAPALTDDSDYALYAMGIANMGGSGIAGQKFMFVIPGAYAYLYSISDAGATNYIDHDEVDTNFQIHVNITYVIE